MPKSIFSEADIRQIEAWGMTLEKAVSQVNTFKKGFPYSRLQRPCTIDDGIISLPDAEIKRLIGEYTKAVSSQKIIKFVPASGAASRMFKLLLSFNNRYTRIDEEQIASESEKNSPDSRHFLRFIKEIRNFAFYDDLKSAMSRDGIDTEALISEGQYKIILEYLLTSRGLNLANLPKGLIKFHSYSGHNRTPFEEHLVEAADYTSDGNMVARICFTISPEYEHYAKEYIENSLNEYEKKGLKFELTFSYQNPSTDTIGVDMDNRPFRDKEGKLLFRPGGHGALLENLNDINADIIFIKNIDNIVPDRLKQETYIYKKALGGYLLELQRELSGYLKRLSNRKADEPLIKRVFEYLRRKLSIAPPAGIMQASKDEKVEFLISKINRPLRVCGMVRNQGEPGGGPFWVERKDRTGSIQIVESSQVDMKSPGQKAIWESSTHFNPVDLVCGTRDYSGKPFNLPDFVDIESGLITVKSKEGMELKALEHPGLWNGAMAHWNTVFIEVPIITFNPVKTVLDLLRREHQPEESN